MSDTPKNLVRGEAWPDSTSRAVATPLQPSVVYASPDADALDAQYDGRSFGYTYSREGHPNATVLARKIDALEGAPDLFEGGGWVTSSGMSAISAALLGLLQSGDHIIGGDQLYGRSLRMLSQTLPRYGLTATLADPTDIAAMDAAIRPETKLILVELVSNPTLRGMGRMLSFTRSPNCSRVIRTPCWATSQQNPRLTAQPLKR